MAIIHLLDDDLAVTQACAFLLESLGYEVMCWAEGASSSRRPISSDRRCPAGYADAGAGRSGST